MSWTIPFISGSQLSQLYPLPSSCAPDADERSWKIPSQWKYWQTIQKVNSTCYLLCLLL